MDYGNLKVPGNVTPEVQAILDNYKAEQDAIQKERNKEMAKLYGGAALQIGSALIPGTLGLKAAGGAIKALTPYVGRKIAENAVTGVTSGLASGAVEGVGRGLMEGKNPIGTAVSDATLGALFGGALGAAGSKIGKLIDEKALQKGNKLPQQYFDEYVAGLSNDTPIGKISPFSKEFGKFRGLKDGYAPGGSKTEYLFAGESAFDVPKGKLMEAQYMANTGDSVDDIYEKTGWFKGVDDKWRYEIPNGEIIQNPNLKEEFDDDIGRYYTTTIGEVLHNPELYRNYPQLKDRSVVIQSMPDGYWGSSSGGSLSLNRDLYSIYSPEYLKKLNELENNPEYLDFKNYETNVFNKLDNLDLNKEGALETHRKLLDELDTKTTEFYNNNPVGVEYDKLVWRTPEIDKKVEGFGDDAFETLLHEVQHQIQDIEHFARGGNNYDSNYKNLAGEVEARLASSRRKLTPEERKKFMPFDFRGAYGYDVKPEEQIVKFGNERQSDLYRKLTDNTVDLTNNFDKTPTIQEVKSHIKDLIDSGKVFDTLDDDWKIDVKGGKKVKDHLAYSSKAKSMNKAQKGRHNKYIMSLENLINNSKYTNNPKTNLKPDKKPNIDTYHYFETDVKIGDKKYKVILNAEQYKGESTIKPQTVHLYDVLEIK